MLRKILPYLVIVAIIFVGFVWWIRGTVNPPVMAASGAELEQLLRERIKLPEGYEFSIFARNIGDVRLMQMTESGDLVVSGYRSGVIYLFKPDGSHTVLASDLDLPHGLLLEGNSLFVAEQSRVVKYDFDGKALSNAQVLVAGLPDDGGHSSRTLKRGPDGYLYLTVGSSCNSCIEEHPCRAAMLRFREGGKPEIFASGLRNTVGFDWQPSTGNLYGVENGRDNLGDDVPDDELNRIEQGRHYGWPFMHGKGVPDPSLAARMPENLEPVPQAHGLGGHVAPLSIRFLKHQADAALNGTALVAEHGSWNRSVKSGYRIVRLTFSGETISEETFMSGCEVDGEVICRPVDILEAGDGTLFVTDDSTGSIYRISRAQ